MKLTLNTFPLELHNMIVDHCDAQSERAWRSTCRQAAAAVSVDRLRPHAEALNAQSILQRFESPRLLSLPVAADGSRTAIHAEQIGGQALLDNLVPVSSSFRTTLILSKKLSQMMVTADRVSARSLLHQTAAYFILTLHEEQWFEKRGLNRTPWGRPTANLLTAWAKQHLHKGHSTDSENAAAQFKLVAFETASSWKSLVDPIGRTEEWSVGSDIDGMVDRFVSHGRRGMAYHSGTFFEKFPGKAIEQANELGTLVALPLIAFREAVASAVADPIRFRTQWNKLGSKKLYSMYDPENSLQRVLPSASNGNNEERENVFALFKRGIETALQV